LRREEERRRGKGSTERGEREGREGKRGWMGGRETGKRNREPNTRDMYMIVTLSLGDFPMIVKIKTTGMSRMSSNRTKMAIKPRTI
jgi:hypothetical protein